LPSGDARVASAVERTRHLPLRRLRQSLIGSRTRRTRRTREPRSATLDLSDATPGEAIVILVQGDTGLGNDPGTFAAIPVAARKIIPATR